MKFRWPAALCAALLGGIAVPANADISAVYEVQSEDDFERAIDFAMTIEVNDRGQARLHLTGRSSYFLIRDGEVFSVQRGIDGPYAERLDDLEAVIEDAGQAGGLSLELLKSLPKLDLVRVGRRTVGKWEGDALAQRDFDGELRYPQLIVSEDDELRPVGAAFAQFIEGRFGALRTMSLVNLFGPLGFHDPEVRSLLKSGTPLRLGFIELTGVSHDAIDEARFELPERILTRDEIREQNRPFEWAPAFDRQPNG